MGGRAGPGGAGGGREGDTGIKEVRAALTSECHSPSCAVQPNQGTWEEERGLLLSKAHTLPYTILYPA